jgi:carbon storage regulator
LLVLGRKVKESFIIGDNIVITILSIDHDHVKIGIEAPREVPIMRGELFKAVQQQSEIVQKLESEPIRESIKTLRDLLMEHVHPDDDEPDPEPKL